MKRYVMIVLALTVLCSCQHDIARKVDFNVTFDPENTFVAGEPVKFNITGDVDNILFYSGKTGHRYENSARYEIPVSSIKDITLNALYEVRYATPGALEVWVADDFAGLAATDSADFAKIAADPEAAGWVKMDYREKKESKDTTIHKYVLRDSSDIDITTGRLCLAFHWCPDSLVSHQRTYMLNGSMDIEIDDKKISRTYSEMGFKSISLNEGVSKDAMSYNNCSIKYNTTDADIALLGFNTKGETTDKYAAQYKWDVWVVSSPVSVINKDNVPVLNVENDKGTVIKNMQNSLSSYESVWEEPGTYTVAFVGTCANYQGVTQMTKTMTLIITEKVEMPW